MAPCASWPTGPTSPPWRPTPAASQSGRSRRATANSSALSDRLTEPKMLEILLLYFLGKKLAGIVRSKGRSSGVYVVLLVVLWLAGEFGGLALGAVISATASPVGEPDGIVMLVGAIVGAALGTTTAFLIVRNLSPIPRHQEPPEGLDDIAT